MKAGFVIDSSALLAWLFGESGKKEVSSALAKGCLINTVNWSEILQKSAQKGIPSSMVYEELHQKEILGTALNLVDFTESLASASAGLFDATKSHGLSLGDRACLALGQERNIPVLTADKDWKKVDLSIEVLLIR